MQTKTASQNNFMVIMYGTRIFKWEIGLGINFVGMLDNLYLSKSEEVVGSVFQYFFAYIIKID